ncbi:MAG: hypothetical protein JW966_03155 [Anaerolineae bacterium]|nr:hypothetical protein [Anaerolineae bacterium]
MNPQHDTQLWWCGVEMEFIKWTPNGLICNRVGSHETIAQLSRKTVRRLLDEGTLLITGYRPDWIVSNGHDQ